MMDTLQHDVGKYFKIEDFTNNHSRGSFRNDIALKEYVKTGKHGFIPDLQPENYESVTDLHEAMKRKKKIHQTNYVVAPKRII